MRGVRFAISTAFLPADQLLALARRADELGYDAVTMPDHVMDLEELETPYPYTPDGGRRWGFDAQWPDPWVLVGVLVFNVLGALWCRRTQRFWSFERLADVSRLAGPALYSFWAITFLLAAVTQTTASFVAVGAYLYLAYRHSFCPVPGKS